MDFKSIKETLMKQGFVEIGGTGSDEVWKPAPGNETLRGTYLECEENMGSKKNSNLYSLETADGKVVKFWGSKVLDDRMNTVEPGELLAVVWKGKVNAKNGTAYHDYAVFHEKAEEKTDSLKEEELEEEVPL